MHNPRRIVKACLALIVLAAFVASNAAAQYGIFGTQLKAGDVDHTPVTKKDGVAVKVNELDLGNENSAIDNCLLLDTGSTAADGAHPKDLRLTPCIGKAAGTQIVASDPEATMTYPNVAAAKVVYADIDGDGKYGKGDYAYLTTGTVPNLAITGATGTWSIRLLDNPGGRAGTFVKSGDADFMAYGGAVATFTNTGCLVEREDKQWYLAPRAVGGATVSKSLPQGSIVPADSVRLGGPALVMPDVRVTSMEVLTPELVAGQPFQVLAQAQNNGGIPGIGVVVSRFGDDVVDVKATPILGPKETANLVLTLTAPRGGTVAELKVGDLFQVVSWEAGRLSTDQGPTSADLAEQIERLERRIAELEVAADPEVEIAHEAAETGGRSPGLDALLTIGLLGFAVAMLVRRRNG